MLYLQTSIQPFICCQLLHNMYYLGSLAHSCTDHHVALAGASGGCYALIGAHLASIVVVSAV